MSIALTAKLSAVPSTLPGDDALKAEYLKGLCRSWRRRDYINNNAIICKRVEELRAKYDPQLLYDCTAYFIIVGSTPPIEIMPAIEEFVSRGILSRMPVPFFDLEGEDSILAFVERHFEQESGVYPIG
ncbi:MAG: hypothetical protein U0487_01085 [Patescibacteria group bacterium]